MNKLIIASTLLFSMSAMAQEGGYVRINVGSTSVDEAGLDDDQTSFGADLGYRFTDVFGAEIGYHTVDTLAGKTGTASNSADVKILTMGLSAKYSLHADEYQGFYIGGRAGLSNSRLRGNQQSGTSSLSLSSSGTKGFAGIGVGYDMTENFSMGLSYNVYGTDIKSPPASKGNLRLSEFCLSAEFSY